MHCSTGVVSLVWFALLFGAVSFSCSAPRTKAKQALASDREPERALAFPRENTASQLSAEKLKAEPRTESIQPSLKLRFPRSSYPWLGLSLTAEGSAAERMHVARVHPGSPAQKAGLQQGDHIVQLNRSDIAVPQQLGTAVRQASVNDVLQLLIVRHGVTQQIEVLLEGTPDDEDKVRLALLGRRAPELAGAVTFQGELSSLREAEGRVLLIDFWASYCGACLQLLPEIERIARVYAAQGLEVIGITVDSSARGREIARSKNLSYTLMSDSKSEVVARYGAQTIPMLVLIDQKGIVREAMIGSEPQRLSELMHRAEELLMSGTEAP